MRCSLRRGVGYTYTYDANGNRATMVSKVDDVVYATTTYSYNIANMVVSMTNDPSNESAQTFAYTYYLDENQRTKTEGTKVTTYAYDYAGRLVSEVTTDNGTPTVGYTYTYDDFGNRLTMTTDGVTTNYTYDLNNRLLQTTAGETTVTYTYNANGDMITEYKVVENIPEQNTTYTYSIYTGMLSSVSSTVGNVNASYDYNASGLRMKNGDTYFIYDGQNIVAEYDLANDEYTAVYGFAVNRVSRFTSGVDGEIYLFNAHGDVVGLVAISGENVGKTIKEYDYDAFGNEVFPDPDDENPFRYCGEYYDKGTNRLYLRARDYDSATGRFTQQDGWGYGDIQDPLSLNMYTYCYNNPILLIDPNGTDAIIINKKVDNAIGNAIGIEHMAGFFQDENGDWWFFNFGEYMLYEKVDSEVVESMESINEYMLENGYINDEGPEYTESVCIEGDFAKSHDYFLSYITAFMDQDEKNEAAKIERYHIDKNTMKELKVYSLLKNNCTHVVMRGLMFGYNADGESMEKIYGSQNISILPNTNLKNLKKIFKDSLLKAR